MIKLDTDRSVPPDVIATVLRDDPRILVAAAQDGFRSTADINEFFRDLGRSHGDRWEAFIWKESIMAVNQSIYLMLDISPIALSIPEGLDAVRVVGVPKLSLAVAQELTDNSLGLVPAGGI